ncbi:MAG: YaiO family outer membrane beta-barrel protein [Balneola sp.]
MRKLFLQIFILALVSFSAFAQSDTEFSNSISISDEYVLVEGIDNWNIVQLGYERRMNSLTLISRLQYADRLGQDGTFLSFIGYPEFSENSYGYVNLGFSPDNSNLFPELRFSSAFYHSLTDQLVGGAGFQYIKVPGEDAFVANIYANYYFGSYLLLIRPSYLIDDSNSSFSGAISLRRYYNSAKSYGEFLIGAGRSIENSTVEDAFQQTYLNRIAALKLDHSFSDEWSLQSSLTLSRNDFSSGTERNQFGVRLGVTRNF